MILSEFDSVAATPQALARFLPFVQQQLGLKKLPKIKIVDRMPEAETTFGRFDADADTIYLVAQGRHVNDVMRTLAHELTHYRQNQQNELDAMSGETGSEEENEANAEAGIVMRNYNRQEGV